jgi:hypothetical protein
MFNGVCVLISHRALQGIRIDLLGQAQQSGHIPHPQEEGLRRPRQGTPPSHHPVNHGDDDDDMMDLIYMEELIFDE